MLTWNLWHSIYGIMSVDPKTHEHAPFFMHYEFRMMYTFLVYHQCRLFGNALFKKRQFIKSPQNVRVLMIIKTCIECKTQFVRSLQLWNSDSGGTVGSAVGYVLHRLLAYETSLFMFWCKA